MPKVFVIQTGQTTWEAQDRIESAAGAPLTDGGRRTVQSAAAELASQVQDIHVIYAGDSEPERQTAAMVAKALGLKVRKASGLHELDYGLWQGLTMAELKRRRPKMYRQWLDAPAGIRPPGGETLKEAQQRLGKTLKDVLKRHKDETALLVLRPVAMALLRCLITRKAVERVWQHMDPQFTWGSYEMDSAFLEAAGTTRQSG